MQIRASQQAKVGFFVFLGLILSMTVIFLLGDGINIFERKYHLAARFDDISGLRLGAPVFLAGIQVGKVEDLRFPKNVDEKQILAYLEIKHEFQDRIHQDSEASIVTQGLLGDKAVFLTMGTSNSPVLEDGQSLTVKESISLDSFAKKGTELLDNVNRLSKNVDSLVTDLKEKEGLLHAIIYDPKGQQLVSDLARVTGSAESIMRHVQQGAGMLHAMIYNPVRQDLGKLVSDTAENFRSLSIDLQTVGTRIQKGEGSIGGLVNDPTVYYDLMTLLGKANRNKLLRTVIRATLATNEKDTVGP